MKRGLILLVFLLSILQVTALFGDMSKSKYSSDIYKIKFDDNPITLIHNRSMGYQYGCGSDGRFFIKFDINSDRLTTDDIKVAYKLYLLDGSKKELKGKFYRRNLQTGVFENVSGKLFSTFEYYFWSDPVFSENNYVVETFNLDGQNRQRTFNIHCPEFRHTCEDFKPIISCYNTNDEKLVIEFSNVNIESAEEFDLSDLFIHTKGTNQLADLLKNTLAEDAVLEKIGDDKYRIISPLLYGNPEVGTNVIKYVYFQDKNCFYDLYPDAYASPNCEGVKNISSLDLPKENQITGAAVAETGSTGNYWIYGIVLLALVVIVVLIARKKKTPEIEIKK